MILWSDDNISISMIFNNLTGQNFKADEYKAYIRNIAFGKMGFVPGTIELYKGGILIASGIIPAYNQSIIKIKYMVTARTLKGAQVYVTFYPDCEENVGGYYCQVYTDENCI